MFIMIAIGMFIAKLLAAGVVALFLIEDLELTRSVGGATYAVYFALGAGSLLSLIFFLLNKRILWAIAFGAMFISYLGMYNTAPQIKEVHQQNNLKSRYFKDTTTFITRMFDVWKKVNN